MSCGERVTISGSSVRHQLGVIGQRHLRRGRLEAEERLRRDRGPPARQLQVAPAAAALRRIPSSAWWVLANVARSRTPATIARLGSMPPGDGSENTVQSGPRGWRRCVLISSPTRARNRSRFSRKFRRRPGGQPLRRSRGRRPASRRGRATRTGRPWRRRVSGTGLRGRCPRRAGRRCPAGGRRNRATGMRRRRPRSCR